MTPRQIEAFGHYVGERHKRRLADMLKVQATAAGGNRQEINKELRRLNGE